MAGIVSFKCAVCGKLTRGRKPRRGDLSERYAARHRSPSGIRGSICPGTWEFAEWVELKADGTPAES